MLDHATPMETVASAMSALTARPTLMQCSTTPIPHTPVISKMLATYASKCPHLFHGMLWEDYEITTTPSAIAMEIMPLLLGLPNSKFLNNVACHTVSDYPNLFQIVTPINIPHFEFLLATHPN